MLRMIACDVDGTLLPKGEARLPDAVLETIRRVTDKGVYFAVCSGRTYYDLRRLFLPVHNRVIYISHDGALALYRNCLFFKRPLYKPALEAVVRSAAPHCAGILLAAKEHTYCPAYKDELFSPLQAQYGAAIQRAENLNAMGEELLKLCFYRYKGDFPVPQGMRIAYADADWLELTCGGADKGKALQAVCRRLGVTQAQIAAFGDGENDLPLFTAAGQCYAVNPQCTALARAADAVLPDAINKIKELF